MTMTERIPLKEMKVLIHERMEYEELLRKMNKYADRTIGMEIKGDFKLPEDDYYYFQVPEDLKFRIKFNEENLSFENIEKPSQYPRLHFVFIKDYLTQRNIVSKAYVSCGEVHKRICSYFPSTGNFIERRTAEIEHLEEIKSGDKHQFLIDVKRFEISNFEGGSNYPTFKNTEKKKLKKCVSYAFKGNDERGVFKIYLDRNGDMTSCHLWEGKSDSQFEQEQKEYEAFVQKNKDWYERCREALPIEERQRAEAVINASESWGKDCNINIRMVRNSSGSKTIYKATGIISNQVYDCCYVVNSSDYSLQAFVYGLVYGEWKSLQDGEEVLAFIR